MSVSSENSLFKSVDVNQIPNLIQRSQFIKRRRKLFLFFEEVRLKLASRFLALEDYFIVDRKPLEVCKFTRY